MESSRKRKAGLQKKGNTNKKTKLSEESQFTKWLQDNLGPTSNADTFLDLLEKEAIRFGEWKKGFALRYQNQNRVWRTSSRRIDRKMNQQKDLLLGALPTTLASLAHVPPFLMEDAYGRRAWTNLWVKPFLRTSQGRVERLEKWVKLIRAHRVQASLLDSTPIPQVLIGIIQEFNREEYLHET